MQNEVTTIINNTEFDYVISLGFSCHIAKGLDSMAYRDQTYPFDWVISDMHSVNCLIQNGFQDFLDVRFLYRDPNYPYIIKHKHYNIDFYHDFSENPEISTQISTIKKRYAKRIARLYNVIDSQKNVLFIRYLKNKEYSPDEIEKIQSFINFMKKRSDTFKIILISNDNGGWTPCKNEHVLHHFILKPNTEYINDSPFSDESLQAFFNTSIKYGRCRYLKNRLFNARKRLIKGIVAVKAIFMKFFCRIRTLA